MFAYDNSLFNMKIKTFIAIPAMWIWANTNLIAQTDTKTGDSISEKPKQGWNIGALPAITFNSDIGFQYGVLANIFNYGDGTLYPDYKYSFYTEWSRTTKGGGINQLFFDSKYLMPWGMRITTDLSYLTQQALDFYGFNGYRALYNPAWEDRNSQEYKTRMFYRLERRLLRVDVGLQKPLDEIPVRLLGGIAFFDIKTQPVNLNKLNKGLEGDEILPDVPGLYDKYVEWGIIPEKEKKGGKLISLKAGLIYDTRDNEANPNRGIWSELLVAFSPSIDKNLESYSKLVFIHRQYFTLIKDKLTFAGRLGYQGTLSGNTPWFMQNYMVNSFPKTTTVDGLGGSRTLRGVLLNRIVADAVAYGNAELRWKMVKKYIWRQNFYIALSAFADGGQTVKEHEVNLDRIPVQERQEYIGDSEDALHLGYGGGLYIAMNQNFVVAINYGRAADKRDGTSGLYINLNFMF
jgi:outer membrane protein assembly factor BamA